MSSMVAVLEEVRDAELRSRREAAKGAFAPKPTSRGNRVRRLGGRTASFQSAATVTGTARGHIAECTTLVPMALMAIMPAKYVANPVAVSKSLSDRITILP